MIIVNIKLCLKMKRLYIKYMLLVNVCDKCVTTMHVFQAPTSPQMLVMSLDFPQEMPANAPINKHKVNNFIHFF